MAVELASQTSAKGNAPRIVLGSAVVAGICLGGAAAFPFMLGRLLAAIQDESLTGQPHPLLYGVILAAFAGGGAGWGWSLARLIGYYEPKRVAVAGGVSFGAGVLVSVLGAFPLAGALQGLIPAEQPTHVIYLLTFVILLSFTCALTGAATGIAFQSTSLAGRLAALGALGAVASFAVVVMGMDAAGLRVGTGNAAMVKVTAAANLAAALVFGAVAGALATRWLPDDHQTEAGLG